MTDQEQYNGNHIGMIDAFLIGVDTEGKLHLLPLTEKGRKEFVNCENDDVDGDWGDWCALPESRVEATISILNIVDEIIQKYNVEKSNG